MQVFLFVVYFLVGCLLSAPYTFLANGNFENFFLSAWILPFVAVFLLIIYMTERSERRWKQKKPRRWGGPIFWGFIGYVCLPILLNGASLLFKGMGYDKIGNFIFAARYISLIAVVLALIAYAMIANAVASLWQRRGGATPPSSPPSTTGGTPQLPVVPEDRLPGSTTSQFAPA